MCGSLKSSRFRRSATTIANLPSGVKYRLYGSATGIGAAGLRRPRIDRRERVALVVQHVQRLQVPRGHDVLRQRADRELTNDLAGGAGRSRRPCCCRCSGRRRAGVRVAWRGGTCSDRPRHRRSTADAGAGACRHGETSKHRRLRSVRAPTAGDEDAGAERDRRRIGERLCARWPAARTRPVRGSIASILEVGVSRLAPRPPITYARPPSAAAAACVVGPGRRPSRRSTAASRASTRGPESSPPRPGETRPRRRACRPRTVTAA